MNNKQVAIIAPEEVDSKIQQASSVLRDSILREEYCIYLRGSYNTATGEIQGSDSFFSLKAVLAEYKSLTPDEKKKFGIWDCVRSYPLDIDQAIDHGIRAPDLKKDLDTGELLGYNY